MVYTVGAGGFAVTVPPQNLSPRLAGLVDEEGTTDIPSYRSQCRAWNHQFDPLFLLSGNGMGFG